MTTNNNIFHLHNLFDPKIYNSLTSMNELIPQIHMRSSYALSFSFQLQKGSAASRRSHGKSMVKLQTEYLFSSWVHQPRAETKANPSPSLFHEKENSPTLQTSFYTSSNHKTQHRNTNPISMWWSPKKNHLLRDPGPIQYHTYFKQLTFPTNRITKTPKCHHQNQKSLTRCRCLLLDRETFPFL